MKFFKEIYWEASFVIWCMIILSQISVIKKYYPLEFSFDNFVLSMSAANTHLSNFLMVNEATTIIVGLLTIPCLFIKRGFIIHQQKNQPA